MSDPAGLADRVRRIHQATIDGALQRGLSHIEDPVERILYEFACRYAGGAKAGDFEAAVDAMDWALAALRAQTPDRDAGERMRVEGAEIDPAWSAFCRMRLALANERGVWLSLHDLERLHQSPIGRLMDAAADYGTSTPGAIPDPVLLTGTAVVPLATEGKR